VQSAKLLSLLAQNEVQAAAVVTDRGKEMESLFVSRLCCVIYGSTAEYGTGGFVVHLLVFGRFTTKIRSLGHVFPLPEAVP
jgi:hypothetical protein